MKKILPLLTFLLFFISLTAQITVDNGTFPVEGDTLYTATDGNGEGLDLIGPGQDLSWDWSSLGVSSTLDNIFFSASLGSSAASFPDADLYSSLGVGSERYYAVSSTEVQELGFVDVDPIVMNFEVTAIYESPYIFARAPLNYLDTYSSTTRLVSTFLFDSIPDTLVAGLRIKPDSIRVRIEIDRDDEVDAWGKMTIPVGTFDVLREKRTQRRTTRVDAYVGILGWSDVTDLISDILPDPSILDTDTTIQYNFLSNDSKEPIAVAIEDSTGAVDQVIYKRDKTVTSIWNKDLQGATVTLSPNPTYGKTSLFYNGLEEGNYSLILYDIIGNEIWRNDYQLNESGRIKQDFDFLNKGTYLYSLVNEAGTGMLTKRLVIITP